MYKPSSNSRQASFFWDLETMQDSKRAAVQVGKHGRLVSFREVFCSTLQSGQRSPSQAYPPDDRLAYAEASAQCIRRAGMLQFTENAYYQYFCGLEAFGTLALVHRLNRSTSGTVSVRRG